MPGKHQKDYYERHREEILTKARERYKDPEYKAWRKAYQRAYSLGLPTPKRGRKKETQQINIES